MNEIVNKCFLSSDKLMPERHLGQPRIAYSACGPFTKNKERIQKFQKNWRFIIHLSKRTR